ncbi:MAG: GNAT family N-acetyltransferase [Mycobacteriales bacterium]
MRSTMQEHAAASVALRVLRHGRQPGPFNAVRRMRRTRHRTATTVRPAKIFTPGDLLVAGSAADTPARLLRIQHPEDQLPTSRRTRGAILRRPDRGSACEALPPTPQSRTSVRGVLIRRKAKEDQAQCLDLLMQVHESDGYPLYLPEGVPAFITPEYEMEAWVAERDGRVVGHVALHHVSVNPTLAAAQQATGLPADRLAVVSRLFTDPALRRAGIGRALLRYASGQAASRGQRAVLDVGKTLMAPVALYESEGWKRVNTLALRVADKAVIDLWVYVSPEASDA